MMSKRGTFEKPGGNSRSMNLTEKAVLTILLLVGLAIVLFYSLGEILIHHDKPTATPPQTAAPDPAPERMESAALAVLEAFFEAPDVVGKAELVRDGSRVRPLMEDFYQHRGHPFPTMGRVSKGTTSSINGIPLVFFEVEPYSGPRYPIAVVWDGRRFSVDWESLTCYGSMDWSEFVETRPTGLQTLRVYLRNAGETDRIPGIGNGMTTFRLEHRDDPQPLLALATGDLAGRLALLAEDRRVPLTLEIAWRPLGAGGQPIPEITSLIAPRWSP